MLYLLAVVGVSVVIVLIDVPTLIKNKWWKEMGVFSFFLIAGLAIGTARAFHLNIPNPLEFVIKINKPIEDLVAFFFGSP
ncbi:hypothetical protein [uncultured Brevibacillus sp.]|uniref:hypothetical protein n=1 Tax=uncultured Brevibacillus sp. TaxID=169970 RepID=UPI002591D459|nr:hypothetical protein [uncultured Brevibacillus sp.]